MKRRSKYNAKPVIIDGIQFDSTHEGKRYNELMVLERAGLISDLQMQVKYTLVPRQKTADGKVAERAVQYIADFVYKDREGNTVVEDAKGQRTREYIIKRKLMLYVHGIRIKEV